MAVFKITPATSRLTNSSGVHGFDSDTPGPDTLIVDLGAFLITQGIVSIGARLINTGAWTVTINGLILADQYSAIALDPGNIATSKITIGTTGEVGGDTGMTVGSPAVIKNAGIITATDFEGILIFGSGKTTIVNLGTLSGGTGSATQWAIHDSAGLSNDTVINSGEMNGAVGLGDGINALTNSGTISGFVSGSDGNDTVSNSKIISRYVALGNGTNKLNNSGTIGDDPGNNFSYLGGTGADTVINSGTLRAGAELSDGKNTLNNKGVIDENTNGRSIRCGIGDDTIGNSKSIVGDVVLSDGTNKLTNSGTIGGTVSCGSGDDTIGNSKSIVGDVVLSDGTNKLTNSGTIGGNVFCGSGDDTIINLGTISRAELGGGDDKYTGGRIRDEVRDGDGSDTIILGGGDDVYRAYGAATDGTDVVSGGKGTDLYEAVLATSPVIINLDKVAHGSAAHTATGIDVAGGFKDIIIGFENARGGSGDDVIHGSSVANLLDSGGGGGELVGYGGNDTLFGRGGTDGLTGGAGKDVLTGGGDADYFNFLSIKDSGITQATRDVITDFDSVLDFIDLQAIDANTKATGDQAFNFVGTNIQTGFSGAAGELHARWTIKGQIIEGDVNGDKKADFSIEIIDPTHAITLMGGDPLLGGDFFL